MRAFFLYYLLARLLGNPLIAAAALIIVLLAVERRFLGFLPDISGVWRRRAKLKQLKEAVKVAPFDARAQLELGMLLFEGGRTQEALPYLEQAGKKLVDHATAQYLLGAARINVGDHLGGAAALRAAIALRPEVQYGMPYVYLTMAALQAKPGKATAGGEGAAEPTPLATEEEIEGWVNTLERYGNSETCYRMGTALANNGRWAEASRMFHAAIAAHQQSPKFARRAGRRWALLARWQLAKLGGR